ncbi:MAG: phage Gp19/Gp15/Gp42 family protein [Lachnospiraceae bacterium]|nr:phage Gp19/Gp15/Gp42 family protein [Lachnospiraceae bacterium]
MSDYATVDDIITLKRSITAEEQERAEALISLVSDIIRVAGISVGRDVDQMIEDLPEYASVVKSVTVGVVLRELDTPAGQLPATQQTETTGSVSLSYSLPNASDTIRLWPSDLKMLGFKKQRYGVIEMWGNGNE